MLAHKANSNVSAYSVRGFRNFYLIGSVTIIKTVRILWQAIVRGLNQYLVLAWFFISSGANEDNGYSQAFTLPKNKTQPE